MADYLPECIYECSDALKLAECVNEYLDAWKLDDWLAGLRYEDMDRK